MFFSSSDIWKSVGYLSSPYLLQSKNKELIHGVTRSRLWLKVVPVKLLLLVFNSKHVAIYCLELLDVNYVFSMLKDHEQGADPWASKASLAAGGDLPF